MSQIHSSTVTTVQTSHKHDSLQFTAEKSLCDEDIYLGDTPGEVD